MAPMTKLRRTALDRALKELCEDLQVIEIVPNLIASGKLSDTDHELIESKVTRADRVRELVRILKTKGDDAFGALVQGLQENENQAFLAKVLLDHEKDVKENKPEVNWDDEPDAVIPPEDIDTPDQLVTDQDLNKIAQGLGSDWKTVGRSLGLKQQQIDACEMDNLHSLHDKIFDMLHKWKKKMKTGATREAIVNSLYKIEVDPEAYEFLLIRA